jgi:hypothetical protein
MQYKDIVNNIWYTAYSIAFFNEICVRLTGWGWFCYQSWPCKQGQTTHTPDSALQFFWKTQRIGAVRIRSSRLLSVNGLIRNDAGPCIYCIQRLLFVYKTLDSVPVLDKKCAFYRSHAPGICLQKNERRAQKRESGFSRCQKASGSNSG